MVFFRQTSKILWDFGHQFGITPHKEQKARWVNTRAHFPRPPTCWRGTKNKTILIGLFYELFCELWARYACLLSDVACLFNG